MSCNLSSPGSPASREFPYSDWEVSAQIPFGPESHIDVLNQLLNHSAEDFLPPSCLVNRRLRATGTLSASGTPSFAAACRLRYPSVINSSAREGNRKENRCRE